MSSTVALGATVLLDYAGAEHALFAIHKRLSDGSCVFAEEVAKLDILVRLLTGGNPDLAQLPATRATAPYRDLACVVMRGNLAAFRDVVQRKQTCFQEDGLLRIVSRQVAERG